MFGHPKGLAILFFTEMWERFSYYGMRAILQLYMLTAIASGGLGLSEQEAGPIYGIYTASVYLLSLPGGWIADNLLGQRKAIWYGGIIIMIGHIILAFPNNTLIFFIGLAVVALGTGLLKPNISSIVGELYPEGGAKRDAGFAVFYMGINIGGAAGMLTVGYLGEKINWHLGFGAAAVGMFLGLVIFKIFGNKYLQEYGLLKKKTAENVSDKKSNTVSMIMSAGLVLLLAFLQWRGILDLTSAAGLAKGMGILIVSIAVFYFAYIFIAGELSDSERKRMYVMALLCVASAIFWAGYEQGGSTLSIFSERHTDRWVFGWEMPASWLQGFQSIYVILLSPVIAAVWLFLGRNKMNPYAPVKFGLGLVILAFAFFIMYLASQYVVQGQKVSYVWLLITYVFTVLGELCISPVGLSFYTKLAPPRFVSQLMGIWFIGTAFGNLMAGMFSGNFDENSVGDMPNLFLMVVGVSLFVGLLMLVFYKPIKNWMGGAE